MEINLLHSLFHSSSRLALWASPPLSRPKRLFTITPVWNLMKYLDRNLGFLQKYHHFVRCFHKQCRAMKMSTEEWPHGLRAPLWHFERVEKIFACASFELLSHMALEREGTKTHFRASECFYSAEVTRRFSKCRLRWQIFKIIVHKLLSTLVTLQLWKHAAHNISSRFLPQFKVLLKSSRSTHAADVTLSLSLSPSSCHISRHIICKLGGLRTIVLMCFYADKKRLPPIRARTAMAQGAPSLPPFDPKKASGDAKNLSPRSQISLSSVRALISGQLADTLKFRRSRPTALRRWLSSIRLYI